jgi:colanic acid biosynthesis glycosyl transferase WcaI
MHGLSVRSMRKFTVRLFNTVEPVTTFYRDLIPYWEQRGWQVHVVISRVVYRVGRDEAWRSSQTKVRYTPAWELTAQGRLPKLFIMLAYIFFAALFSLFGPRVDRNVFLTQPPLFFIWGWVLQKLRRQPYYIVLMDLYPDVAIQDGLLAERSLLTRFLLTLSRFGLRHADGLIVIGRCMAQRLVQLGIRQDRIHIIPNWTNEEKVRALPHAENGFRQQMGWQDKFVILYSGNIGTSHYFDDLLEVCNRLREREDVRFVFIGQGQRRREVEHFQAQRQLKNIQILPFQPQKKLTESLGAGDLHFVSLRSAFTGLVVPSKSYGILAVGRPILYQGETDGEIARLIQEENVGQVVALGQPEQLEASILAYLNNPDLASEQGVRARKLAESRYSKEVACARYVEVLQAG